MSWRGAGSCASSPMASTSPTTRCASARSGCRRCSVTCRPMARSTPSCAPSYGRKPVAADDTRRPARVSGRRGDAAAAHVGGGWPIPPRLAAGPRTSMSASGPKERVFAGCCRRSTICTIVATTGRPRGAAPTPVISTVGLFIRIRVMIVAARLQSAACNSSTHPSGYRCVSMRRCAAGHGAASSAGSAGHI